MSRVFQYRIFTGKYLSVSYSDLTKEDIQLNQDFHYIVSDIKHTVEYDSKNKVYSVSNKNVVKPFKSYSELKHFLKDFSNTLLI